MTMQPCSAAMGAHLAETSAPAEKKSLHFETSQGSTSRMSTFLPPKRTRVPSALRLEASGWGRYREGALLPGSRSWPDPRRRWHPIPLR